jgi:hypothetical protein
VKDCLDVLAASIDAEAARGYPDLQVIVITSITYKTQCYST